MPGSARCHRPPAAAGARLMASLIFQVLSWPTFAVALLVFGFAPGAVLRLIVLVFPRDDPRRQELLAELYDVPRIERPFWVVGSWRLRSSKVCASALRGQPPAGSSTAGTWVRACGVTVRIQARFPSQRKKSARRSYLE